MKVTLVQSQLYWHDRERNRERLARHLAEAQPQTDLIVLPEMFTTGFSMNAPQLAEPPQGPTYEWMCQQAQLYNAVVVGSFIVEEEGKYFNRLLAVSPAQKLLASYDKRHLFRMANEDQHYAAGHSLTSFVLERFKIRPLICYDLRFPIWSRNRFDAQGQAEYDLLIYVANWPERRGAQWTRLLQARAIENQSYVVGVNRVGVDGNGIVYRGDSAAYDPWGDPLVEIVRGESVETVELDYEKLSNFRTHFPAWRDADAFHLV